MVNSQEIIDSLTSKLAKYLTDNNLKCMVLGVSGGLDSTIVAFLCSQVYLATEIPLHCISMPSSTNSREETTGAILTQRAFANTYTTINIDNSYAIVSTTALINGDNDKICKGNLKARLRMMYLMDAASKRNGVVIGTDNKSEHELGFYTIFGDQGMIEPIAGLYKTELYEIAHYVRGRYKQMSTEQFNPKLKNCMLALDYAINNKPSDGNGVGDDETQIGAKYEIIDKVLRGEEIEDKEVADKILARVKNNEFKKHIPIYLDYVL